VQQELGPIVATMTDDEVETWITVLAEGGSADPLGLLSWGALTNLARTMACRLYDSRTDKSSDGLPHDESSKPNEAENVTE